MRVVLKNEPGLLRATLDGDALEHQSGATVTDEVLRALGQGDTLLLVFDSVKSIDSAGVGALVTILKSVRRLGGRMALVGVGPQVLTVLKIIRLTTVFEIFEDEPSALAALAQSASPSQTPAI